MNRTRWKDTLRLIRNSKGRYITLILIVLIGTAFFTGVSSSSTMMASNVDAYSDELNLKDITVYSSYGFDEDDIQAIKALDEVKEVEGGKFVDVIASSNDDIRITRIHSYDASNTINQFVLVDGRLPEKNNEVLAEAGSDLAPGYTIGTTLSLSRVENDLDDYITEDEVIVVGIIDTPLYLNETKENSTINNQDISTYLYMLENAFSLDFYLEVNVITENGKQYNSFYSAYAEYANRVKEDIETLAISQANHRKQTIVDEAMEQYEEGYQEYLDALKEYNTQIEDAQKQLDDAFQQIQDGEDEINQAKRELDDGLLQLENEIQNGQSQIDDGVTQYNEGYQQYLTNKQNYDNSKQELNNQIQAINDGIATIDASIPQLEQMKSGYAQILESEPQLEEAINNVTSLSNMLDQIVTNGLLTEDDTIQDFKALIQSYIDHLNPIVQMKEDSSINDLIMMSLQTDEYKATFANIVENEKDNTASEVITKYPDFFASVSALPLDTSVSLAQYVSIEIHSIITQLESLGDDITWKSLSIQDEMSIKDALNILNQTKTTLETQYTDLQSQKQLIEQSLADNQITYDQIDTTIESLKTQREQLVNTLQYIQTEMQSAETQLADALVLLQSSLDELTKAQNDLNAIESTTRAQIEDGYRIIADNEALLNDSKTKYYDSLATFLSEKEDGQVQLDEAKVELEDAKKEIDDMEDNEWTVLDRSGHYASETFKNTVQQMKSIADIFPVFFLLVAALVCLTTMRRMVDEERGQIGIIRALGYTTFQCMSKYLFYAFSATVIGVVLGAIIGLFTFPYIIYTAWEMMYILPDMKIYVDWTIIIQAAIAFLIVTTFTTYLTIRKELKDVPSQLLRPKSPSLGKSLLLERIPFIWNRITFTWKVTIRNLARYKQRFIMTVIGVGGCTALLITGFGVKDSIENMVSLQFDEMYMYDGTITLKDDIDVKTHDDVQNRLLNEEEIASVVSLSSYTTKIYNTSLDETANLMIFTSNDQLEEFIHLRTRKGHNPITLGDEGIIISEKLSENLDVKIGDSITIESESGKKRDVVIADICETYIQHYIFMSHSYYELIFDESIEENTFLVVKTDETDSTQLSEKLMAYEEIQSINFIDGILQNFNSMVSSLDFIVIVLIASSMLLAFVVLGNLTNINIRERQREIATLKVLGFRKKEVESYIYKENNVLTFVGALFGIPLGNYLHHWIMRQVEMDYVMFGRSVDLSSFMISVGLTVLFGVLVNQFMKKRLTDIEMVESLKSVE